MQTRDGILNFFEILRIITLSIFKGYFVNSMYRKLQTRTNRQKYSTLPSNEIYIKLYFHLKKEKPKDVHVNASNKEIYVYKILLI